MAPVVPAPFLPAAPPDLLRAALEISLTGFILFRPVWGGPDPALITDLAYEYLNPAAQRMLGLPERPAESFLTLYPGAEDAGIMAFHRDTFRAGGSGRFDVNYQHDGLDNYYQLVNRRCGDLLLLSFSDTAEQPRTAVEVALRQSQAREQAARAEAEHQQAEWRRLFEQAPVALGVFRGPQYVVELANPVLLGLWGRTRAQALGQPLFELLPASAGRGLEEVLDQVLATGEPHEAHELPVVVDRDGTPETAYGNFAYQPLREADGRVTGVAVLTIEVTEQVRARRQLEELNQELEARVFERTQALRHAQAESVAAAQRLLRITESLPSTSFTADQTGRVLTISPQWYAYTGTAPGSDINEAWPRLIHPDDLPTITQEFGAALAGGRAWRYEFRLRGADGAYRWFASQGVPEPLAEAQAAGRPRQWFGSNLDIDDLKQAHRGQEQQRELLATILATLPAGVFAFEGEDFRYSFFNELFQQRVRGRAVLGQPLAELFPEAEEQGFLDLLRGVLRTGEPHRAYEVPTFVRDPRTGAMQEMFLNLTYQPLRYGSAAPHGVLAFTVDVTERVQARARAEALQAELLAAARQQAREREALYQIFEQTPAFICLLRGPEHRYEYLNLAHQRYFAGHEFVGRTVAEAQPEAVAQGFVALLDGVYQSGESFLGYELPFATVAPDGTPGEPSYFDITYQALREDGQVTGISIFSFDVTARVQARLRNEALQAELLAAARQQGRERETFYRVFEQTPALVALLRAPGHRIEYANAAYQALFPGRQLVGLDMAVAIPETREQGFIDLLDGVYRTGETYFGNELPFAISPPAGQPASPEYYNFTYQAYREDGAIAGISLFAFNVTQQVLARQEREAQQQQLRDLFEQAPVAISILRGADYVIEVANPLVAQLWGRTPAELLGRPVFEALPEARDQGFQELLDGVRQSGQAFVAEGVPAQLRRGDTLETVYLNYVYQPLRAADGTITSVAAVATDVTAQVRDRQRVQELNDQLAASNAGLAAANQQLTRINVDLDTFVYTASHDLKLPIANIEGLVAALRDELPTEAQPGDVPHILNLMQESVERFRQTIDQLADVGKLQAEYNQPASAVALAPVIASVRLDLAALLLQTGGQLDVDVRAVPTVLFSEKNLRSVVFNLLSNALKYHHPDRPPQVRVRARLEGAHAVLEVQDNGLGFDLAREAQLFAMFERLHTHVEGSGVGLYMVKRLVENAGGRVAVASEVGQGSVFTVYLPQ